MRDYRLLQIHGYGPGRVAYVKLDPEDYEYMKQWSWKMSGPHGYARRTIRRPENKKQFQTLYMHQLITHAGDHAWETDHINGDPLDNRKCNLRWCSTSENQVNRHRTRGACNSIGVCRSGNRYEARITRGHVRYYLGRYDTIEEATDVIKKFDEEYNSFRYIDQLDGS